MKDQIKQQIHNKLGDVNPYELLQVYADGTNHYELIAAHFYDEGYNGYPTWFIIFNWTPLNTKGLIMIPSELSQAQKWRITNFTEVNKLITGTRSEHLFDALYSTPHLMYRAVFTLDQAYDIVCFLIDSTKTK